MSTKGQPQTDKGNTQKQQAKQLDTQDLDTQEEQVNLTTTLQRARSDPNSLTPRNVQHLQLTIGNRMTHRLLGVTIQRQLTRTKLAVNAPDYKDEQAVDQVDKPLINNLNALTSQSQSTGFQNEPDKIKEKEYTPTKKSLPIELLRKFDPDIVQRTKTGMGIGAAIGGLAGGLLGAIGGPWGAAAGGMLGAAAGGYLGNRWSGNQILEYEALTVNN